MSNRLDRAIEDFEDETLDLTLGERISRLRQAFTWAAFHRIKRIHKLGKKSIEAEEEEFKQVECQKQMKIIEQMYTAELRQMKRSGKNNEDKISEDFIAAIKEMKSSVGSIVRDLNVAS